MLQQGSLNRKEVRVYLHLLNIFIRQPNITNYNNIIVLLYITKVQEHAVSIRSVV